MMPVSVMQNPKQKPDVVSIGKSERVVEPREFCALQAEYAQPGANAALAAVPATRALAAPGGAVGFELRRHAMLPAFVWATGGTPGALPAHLAVEQLAEGARTAIHNAAAAAAVQPRAMSNMVTNTEMDAVIPDLTTADRKYLVADGAARSVDANGGPQVWDVSTVQRYATIRQREREKRYGYGSRAQVGRAHVRAADLCRQREALRAVGRGGRARRGAWAGDMGRNANAHHPGYAAAVQALRTRGGEPAARFYAVV
eukprot:g7865.t1